jgi:hypothetical protein
MAPKDGADFRRAARDAADGVGTTPAEGPATRASTDAAPSDEKGPGATLGAADAESSSDFDDIDPRPADSSAMSERGAIHVLERTSLLSMGGFARVRPSSGLLDVWLMVRVSERFALAEWLPELVEDGK